MNVVATTTRAALVAVIVLATQGRAATIDFETVAIGTMYGSPVGDAVGLPVLEQEGISMSLAEFLYDGETHFGDATIGGRYAALFETTPLELDHINVEFDFSNIGFLPTLVTIEYIHFGGPSNFSVNGRDIRELTFLSDLPADVAPGVTAVVYDTMIELIGPIKSVLIGGQELSIDNITAIPEPSVLALLMTGTLLALRRSRRSKV